MKYIVLTFVYVTIICVSSVAIASEKYIGLNTGAFMPSKTSLSDVNGALSTVSFDTGYGIGGVYGVALDSGLRVETELTYKQADIARTTGSLWVLASLVNIYWDARNRTPLTPYFGGGFGFARSHVDSPGPWDGDTAGAIAYQVGGGFGYKLNPYWTLDVGYRYFGTAASSSSISGSDIESNNISLGIRYTFN